MSERKIEVGKYYRCGSDKFIFRVESFDGESSHCDAWKLDIYGICATLSETPTVSLGEEVSKEEVEVIKAQAIAVKLAKMHKEIDPF